MMIDKMLHEKHLGLQWQNFPRKPYQQRRRPQQHRISEQSNQLQSNQSAINAKKFECLDRKLDSIVCGNTTIENA